MSIEDSAGGPRMDAGGLSDKAGAGARRQCPICGQLDTEQYRPFCSKRCADVDLNRWLTGAYAVPGNADAEEDGMAGTAVDTADEMPTIGDDDDQVLGRR